VAEIWIVSDTHFGHANILTFKSPDGSLMRAFASTAEMDDHMIQQWNAVVRPQDHVYHLGDVAMRRDQLPTVKALNGHLRLVLGNHDIYS
jgi:calcineurin-like phosphoesterase family protein